MKTWTFKGAHIIDRDGTIIATVEQWTGSEYAKQASLNNGRLLAAAPDMHNALQMCVDFIKRAHGGEGMNEDERWALLDDAKNNAVKVLEQARKEQ